MITFFRKIRQKLLSQNQITRYLVYALGEIVLVVIGILIALQINTWNENIKLNQQQKSYLTRLIQENKSDVLTFAAEIERLEKNSEKIANLSSILNSKVYSDSLLVLSTTEFIIYGSLYPSFNPSISTYEDLSSTGNLGIIKDTGLRDQIVAHYKKYQAVELDFKVNTDWAIPIDAPLFMQTDALRFDTGLTSFLFSEISVGTMADEIKANQELYLRNAALHYWINKDCIRLLNEINAETLIFINHLEDSIKSDKKSSKE